MKYLAAPELVALSNCIAGRIVGDVVYDGHAEAYSCEARDTRPRDAVLNGPLERRRGPIPPSYVALTPYRQTDARGQEV
jgi:hypothetical protein